VYQPNPHGTPKRTVDEAVRIAEDAGVTVDPSLVQFRVRPAILGALPPNVYAQYFSAPHVTASSVFHWDDIASGPDRTVMVRLDPSVLDSDEKIVGVIAHETHEITGLFDQFSASGWYMTAATLHGLIDPCIGTLHIQAWAYSNDIVQALRSRR